MVTLLAGLAVAGCGGHGESHPPEAGDRGLQYVLVPHPDDEYQAWSLVAERADAYPVFLLLTRGERTSLCDGSGFAGEHGEREPDPVPWESTEPDACAAARVDSWHAMLDGLADLDATLDVPERAGTVTADRPQDGPAPTHPERDEAPLEVEVFVGDDSARLVYDLGDGSLTSDEVEWAVNVARDLRGDLLPSGPDIEAVGAAYAATDDTDCLEYAHPDHVAVHEALERDLGVDGEQYARTCEADPRADVVATVDAELHEAVWEVDPGPPDPARNPDAERVGVAQRVYGWLAFGFGEDDGLVRYWEPSETDDVTPFSRRQAFWTR